MATIPPTDDPNAGLFPGVAPVGPPPGPNAAPSPNDSATAGEPAQGAAAAQSDQDARLVQETRNQIRAIVQEITQLTQSDLDEDAFYAEFLNRVVSALASDGGAIWTVADEGISLRYQVNLPRGPLYDDQDSAARHHLLLQQMLADGQPALAPPYSGSKDPAEPANPTDKLLIFGFVQFEGRPLEIIEIFQRPNGGPTTQRGYLRFLVQMCDLAESYVTRRRLRNLHAREALWDSLERFIHGVHRTLDVQDTCFALVNEARQLVQCDRVSIAVKQGRRYPIEAVSGLDSLDRRAEEVRLLGQLAARVAASKQTLWNRDTDQEPLAPQIEQALDAYRDQSHAKLVVVEPLYAPPTAQRDDDEAEQASVREPIGALIFEQLRDGRVAAGTEERIHMIARHGGSALANAVEHDRLFLMPLWKAIGKTSVVVSTRALPKTLAVIVALVAIVLALTLTPAPLKYSCNGQLVPAKRYDRFAQVDGVVDALPAHGGQIVEPGDLLVSMRSAPLQEKKTRLEGELQEKQQHYKAQDAILIQNERLDRIEQQRIEGELRRLEKAISNLRDRIRLVEMEEAGLKVYAQERGQVANWRLRDRLDKRPVKRGESLITLFDPAGDWELELWMPERRLGRIDEALRTQSDAPLLVTFVLTAHPDQEFQGRLVEVQRTADVKEGEGNIVRLRVEIDKTALPELRNEATLTAQIHCGQASVGTVWFGDAIDAAMRQWLLWF